MIEHTKILAVIPDHFIARCVKRILQGYIFKNIGLTDNIELAFAYTNKFDIVLLDESIFDRNALNFIQKILQTNPLQKVLILGAEQPAHTEDCYYKNGAYGYPKHSWNIAQLKIAVTEITNSKIFTEENHVVK